MPKVLLPTLDAPGSRGGIARYVEAIVATFPHDVEVLVCDPRSGTREMFGLLRKAPHAQIWATHVLPVGTAAWLSRLLKGKPYVVFLHGLDFDLARRTPWKRWLTRQILRRALRVVTNSSALAHEVSAFADIAAPLVVYPCVSDDLVEASRPLDHSTTRPLTLLTVSRLVERKGHGKVLRAMSELPNTVYRIVGDGPMRESLQNDIARFGLSSRVTVLGELSDEAVMREYADADVFVMPATQTHNDREGFGTVYLEAGLFGLPVVAVQTPGVDEAVVDGKTGLLISDDHDALVAALLRLYDDREFAADLGRQGRERVLAEFTREAQFGRLRALL